MKGWQIWSPLLLRIAVGSVFIVHGSSKLFGGVTTFAGHLSNMGFPIPLILAWIVAIVEFFGGIAVLIGFGTRIASALIGCVMIVAILAVHTPGQVPFSGQGGSEFPLTLLMIATSLVISGPGPSSLEFLLFRKKD